LAVPVGATSMKAIDSALPCDEKAKRWIACG